jgi:ABC-2 type transport system ATP-binding protein
VGKLFTAEENLIPMGHLHHLPRRESRRRAAELLERFGLVDAAKKYAATYSGGMTRRLDLAMGLMGEPSVVLLEEPNSPRAG